MAIGLNKEQNRAVYKTDGPVLILAGAGSGKTRVVTQKIAHLILDNNVPSWKILALTFTNKAAKEMNERIEALISRDVKGLWIGTFHSICCRILRREKFYDGNFSIFDSDDQKKMIKTVLKKMDIKDDGMFTPNSVISKISSLKNSLMDIEEFSKNSFTFYDEKIVEIYKFYEKELEKSKALDFDDLLLKTLVLLKEEKIVRQKYCDAFSYLMVDEFQDTNGVQYELIRLLSETHNNITVVGDDDQSIYSWRGADITNILNFEKDYPACEVIKLEQNYRSTANILNAAYGVIKNNDKRKEKKLWTENPAGAKLKLCPVYNEKLEARTVIKNIIENKQTDTAIFYRTNSQSRSIEDQLRNNGVPYKIVGGVRFYDRMEVKDIIAYLRLLLNPADAISFKRVINTPRRGIGKTSIDRLEAFAEVESITLLEAASRSQEISELSKSAALKILQFISILRSLKEIQKEQDLATLVEETISISGYKNMLKNSTEEEASDRIENIEELINSSQEHSERKEDASLETFLEEIALINEVDSIDNEKDESTVTLMTVHSAKGLEFTHIHIVGLEEGLFPLMRNEQVFNKDDLEEERRLFYVAITRAEKDICMYYAITRKRFGFSTSNPPSSFLSEIPVDLVDKKEVFGSPDYAPSSKQNNNSWSKSNYKTKTNSFKTKHEYFNTKKPQRSSNNAINKHSQLPLMDDNHSQIEHSAEIENSKDSANKTNSLKRGNIVRHPLFGRGKILSTSGAGEHLLLEIMFEKAKKKKLMAKFANLQYLG